MTRPDSVRDAGSGSGPVEAGTRKDRSATHGALPSTVALPTLTETTICFPEPGGGLRCEFYDRDAIEEIEQAANRSVGEWLAFMRICWGDDA